MSNLDMLGKRIRKLGELSPYTNNDESKTEWFTYFDMIIVQLRAMFIEGKNDRNYTFQNFLMRRGRKEQIQKVEEYLNSPFINEDIVDMRGKTLSIRTAIKILADKYICHYDVANCEERAKMEMISSYLSNTTNDSVSNVKTIVNTMLSLVKID